MSKSPATGETHIVIGGAGFLGSAIVRALKGRGETEIVILDVRAPTQTDLAKVPFESVDITSPTSLQGAFLKLKPDVVYHTASPVADSSGKDLYEKVNVQGTVNVIEASQKANVMKLVFTSSAGVIFDGRDLINVDERMPFPEKPLDSYNDTKARAEQLVLLANTDEGAVGLKTCAIRPAGIFGPGDRQALPGFFDVYHSGRMNVQIGNNINLFDWTYVDNVAHAHLLAADRLSATAKPYSAELLASVHLPSRCLGEEERGSIRNREIPTSEVRESVSGAPDYARELPSTLPTSVTRGEGNDLGLPSLDLRPVVRNKYDQFFHIVNPDVPSAGNPMPDTISIAEESVGVAGNVFFVTNGQPIPFWDFPRALWKELDPEKGVVDPSKVWKIPKDVGLSLAGASEWAIWLVGGQANFTRFKVTYSACARYYNIEKARRILGYEPLVGMEEAIRRSVKWYKEEGQ